MKALHRALERMTEREQAAFALGVLAATTRSDATLARCARRFLGGR